MKKIALSEIQAVSDSELKASRLQMLLNGVSSFEQVMNSGTDPITLDARTRPYGIVDGRHRIHLARKKGYSFVLAKLL